MELDNPQLLLLEIEGIFKDLNLNLPSSTTT